MTFGYDVLNWVYDEPPAQFTGQYRDQESCLDNFVTRYMSPAQGRFTSPDAPFADQHVGDPQSWNLYAYGRNNPLVYTDPSGMCVDSNGKSHPDPCEFSGITVTASPCTPYGDTCTNIPNSWWWDDCTGALGYGSIRCYDFIPPVVSDPGEPPADPQPPTNPADQPKKYQKLLQQKRDAQAVAGIRSSSTE